MGEDRSSLVLKLLEGRYMPDQHQRSLRTELAISLSGVAVSLISIPLVALWLFPLSTRARHPGPDPLATAVGAEVVLMLANLVFAVRARKRWAKALAITACAVCVLAVCLVAIGALLA
jgi:hypothetical protein